MSGRVGGDFWFVARACGFEGADMEDPIATREW